MLVWVVEWRAWRKKRAGYIVGGESLTWGKGFVPAAFSEKRSAERYMKHKRATGMRNETRCRRYRLVPVKGKKR